MALNVVCCTVMSGSECRGDVKKQVQHQRETADGDKVQLGIMMIMMIMMFIETNQSMRGHALELTRCPNLASRHASLVSTPIVLCSRWRGTEILHQKHNVSIYLHMIHHNQVSLNCIHCNSFIKCPL